MRVVGGQPGEKYQVGMKGTLVNADIYLDAKRNV